MSATSDPARSAEAWRRYRRLLKIMLGVTAAAIAAAFAFLHATGSPMPWPFLLAVAIAIAGSLMLAAALMGLVFLSSTIGADENAHTPPDQ
jgi:peptidoglycan/LPS O-acetylase OafA/YrhL